MLLYSWAGEKIPSERFMLYDTVAYLRCTKYSLAKEWRGADAMRTAHDSCFSLQQTLRL